MSDLTTEPADALEAQYAADEQAAKADDARAWHDILDDFPPPDVWVEAEGQFGLSVRNAPFSGVVRYRKPAAPPYDHMWETREGDTYWIGFLFIDRWRELAGEE